MKRIISALLLAIMIFALASCGNTGNTATEETTTCASEATSADTPRVVRFDISYNEAMHVGSEQKIEVDVELAGPWPDIAPEKRFESSDEKVLTVDNDGNVRAISKGTATVTVRESTLERTVKITVFEGPIPFSKHAETPTATVLIDGSLYSPHHELAVSSIGGVIGDGYDIFKSNYLPEREKIDFVHFCRDSEISITAGGNGITGVLVYDSETGENAIDSEGRLTSMDLSMIGSLPYGRYVLKFYATDRGNGAFANDYITEVFFVGIEISDDQPHIDPRDVVCYKPVIYLYPVEPTEVTVRFENPGNLITTYPKYAGEWRVFAGADGTLTDENGRQYYALFFDEERTHEVDFSTGFYVTAEGATEFLEEKLAALGFTEREADEFIMFWLPVLEKNGQSLVYFEQTAERDAECPIDITPAPESVLRVIIHIKKVDAPVGIEEQTLVPFERQGFTLVEWGGTTY